MASLMWRRRREEKEKASSTLVERCGASMK